MFFFKSLCVEVEQRLQADANLLLWLHSPRSLNNKFQDGATHRLRPHLLSYHPEPLREAYDIFLLLSFFSTKNLHDLIRR